MKKWTKSWQNDRALDGLVRQCQGVDQYILINPLLMIWYLYIKTTFRHSFIQDMKIKHHKVYTGLIPMTDYNLKFDNSVAIARRRLHLWLDV